MFDQENHAFVYGSTFLVHFTMLAPISEKWVECFLVSKCSIVLGLTLFFPTENELLGIDYNVYGI